LLISLGLAVVAAGAVWTRQPPPSVTRVVGVSTDTGPSDRRRACCLKPDSQAVRTTVEDMAVRWVTIEPVLSDRLETSRMTANSNSVRAQTIGAAAGQFRDWLKADTPFQQITANPKLIREVDVRDMALLEDSTVLVEFTATTSQAGSAGKPDVKSYALTLRCQMVAPTAEQALTTNPFGIFIPLFRLERTAYA
ncbi:VirB8 family type IV secretion system protein, partial [Caballeronia grimmiae]|uniref:type IV secretion system protein n=1 Tax=Caballeronia grimmiae TaxID=1071679 RepID=UPI0038BB7F28